MHTRQQRTCFFRRFRSRSAALLASCWAQCDMLPGPAPRASAFIAALPTWLATPAAAPSHPCTFYMQLPAVRTFVL